MFSVSAFFVLCVFRFDFDFDLALFDLLATVLLDLFMMDLVLASETLSDLRGSFYCKEERNLRLGFFSNSFSLALLSVYCVTFNLVFFLLGFNVNTVLSFSSAFGLETNK